MEVNAQIMMEVLNMRDLQVELAVNGRNALEMFRDHPEGYYNAILMDVRMPEMDGLEATAAIRKLERSDAKKIPIIALTANAFDEDVQRSLQVGMNAHLSKPINPDHLYQTLEEMIWTAENRK
jgi:CheY-like chemotaxis protein